MADWVVVEIASGPEAGFEPVVAEVAVAGFVAVEVVLEVGLLVPPEDDATVWFVQAHCNSMSFRRSSFSAPNLEGVQKWAVLAEW